MLSTVAPSRARGLKRTWQSRMERAERRRAFTGAWIETKRLGMRTVQEKRRAFTGAWIETVPDWWRFGGNCVAPSRARGLKLLSWLVVSWPWGRAFTGAWIETPVDICAIPQSPGRAFTGAWIETLES